MNTAAKVRAEKERNPERFCRVQSCLWRIKTAVGDNPCRKHPIASVLVVEPDGDLPNMYPLGGGSR